jgi:SAM-dependent methyltransferase
MSDNDLPFSPAAERNKAPILAMLQRWLPAEASVLEIASGSGQHAAHFATVQPQWTWQPTDADASALPGIARRCSGLDNVRPPLQLDVLAPWPATLGRFDAIYCANMLHISPWSTCAALMQGVASHLKAGGALVLYGPYLVDGEEPAPSNLAFDASLRSRDPSWGLRRLDAVLKEAQARGLAFEQRADMPANNLMLLLRRHADIGAA